MMKITPVVKQLLIINVLFFVLSQVVPQSYDLLALHYFESEKFRFWQPLTHMFMHARMPNFTHIVFNMFALYSFGTALEYFWGGKRFLLFYIICGLGAALVQTAFNYYEIYQVVNQLQISSSDLQIIFDTPYQDIFDASGKSFGKVDEILTKVNCTQNDFNNLSPIYGSCVGASGAIYGLLVAYAFMFPLAEMMMIFIPFPVKAKYFVPIMVGLDLFSGVTGFRLFSGGNIAHIAHVGGALTGFILMMIWRKNKFKFNRLN
jgi:membrane associated rhomboid family serine protease